MHPENKSWKIIFKHINTGHVIFALTFLTAKSILALTLHKLNPGDLKTTLLTAFSLALLLSLIFIIALAFFNKEKEKNSQNNDKHPTNPKPILSDYEIIKNKFKEFEKSYKPSRVRYFYGDQLVQKGEEANNIYFLEKGNIVIDDETGREKEERIFRYAGSIVGESAIFASYQKSTVSIYIYSPHAELIKISRTDLQSLCHEDKKFQKALQYLYRQHSSRADIIEFYAGNSVRVDLEMCTALLGDIHAYSILCDKVSEEMASPFRYHFLSLSEDIAQKYNGLFEDQGDGFKIIFRGRNNIENALFCGTELQKGYQELISQFSKLENSFSEFGLGIGITNDEYTIMSRKKGEKKNKEREVVIGNSINLASALSKHYEKTSESYIYCNEHTYNNLKNRDRWHFEGLYKIRLKKLGQEKMVYLIKAPGQDHDGTKKMAEVDYLAD